MRINCLNCGHTVDLGDAYSHYAGPVKCFICRSYLEIRAKDGKIRSMKLVPITEKLQKPLERNA